MEQGLSLSILEDLVMALSYFGMIKIQNPKIYKLISWNLFEQRMKILSCSGSSSKGSCFCKSWVTWRGFLKFQEQKKLVTVEVGEVIPSILTQLSSLA